MLICTSITTRTTQKSYKRWMVETIIRGDKKGRPKDAQPARTKKKRERTSPSCDRRLSHP
jgi:hypothetical protein